jgi:hypothetical protein
MSRALLIIVGFVGGIFFLLLFLVAPGLVLEPPITLLIGWWPSGVRMLQACHPHPTGAVWFLLAVIVLVAGTRAFLQWLTVKWRGKSDGAVASGWRWKWTVCGFGIVFCSLVAISSLVLTTHQLYWLSKSSDGLFGDPWIRFPGLHAAARELNNTADDLEWDNSKTRQAFEKAGRVNFGQPVWEETQAVWIEQDEHHLRAVVLIPRHPVHRRWARIAVVQPGTNCAWYELDKLPEVLAAFGIGDAAQIPTEKTALLP